MPSSTRDAPVHPAVKTLGQSIARARKSARLTQEALALRAGMQPAEVSKIERGLQDPRWSTVYRLATALEIPAGKLVDGPS